MPAFLETLNGNTAIVDKAGKITTYFAQKWRDVTSRIESAAFVAAGQLIQVTPPGAGTAAIVTAVLVASVSAPVYRIGFDLRIFLPSGGTSAAQVTIGWTENGVAQTKVGASVTGNTTTSTDSDVFQIRPDAGTVVTYAVSYASTGAPAMQFSFDVIAEGIG